MSAEIDPNDIIENYHKAKEPSPRLCRKCRGELKRKGVRTSASVNYTVWICKKCDAEELEFQGLDKDAEQAIEKQNAEKNFD